jgi:hypothetical protein
MSSQDENDALAGNFVDSDSLEPEAPSDTNRYVTSSKIFAAPTELSFPVTPTYIELDNTDGPYFVGVPTDPEATVGTAQQWFNLYDLDETEDSEYTNDQFQAVKVTEVRTGPQGGPPSANELNPQTDGNVDALGFYSSTPLTSLFLITDNSVTDGIRVSYGKRTRLGDLLPQLLMSRGPAGGQIDTRLMRLLLGTPNAQFDTATFDGSVSPGNVVAWNGTQFVIADPDGGLTPVGVRGNSNNLIQEGLFVSTNPGAFTTGLLYADKANPGQLTNTPNEWFIGRAISQSQLLVNMNAIPLEASGEVVPPVMFPEALFSPTLQPGQTVAFILANLQFETADPDDADRIPLGIRGNNNNVIQSSKYIAASGSPFVAGKRYYFGRSATSTAGSFTDVPNDWPLGVGIDSQTLLVNATNFPIPRNWSREHDPESGYHNFQVGTLAERDAIVNPEDGAPLGSQHTGMIFVRTDSILPRIDYWTGSSWAAATDDRIDVPSGSRMIFVQDTVPTGWTLDASINDAVVRIVDNAAAGNVQSGTWVITGIVDSPVTLEADQVPLHRHKLSGQGGEGDTNRVLNTNGPDTSDVAAVGDCDPAESPFGVGVNTGDDNATTSTNDAHQHGVTQDGTWRPFNITAIVCVRS